MDHAVTQEEMDRVRAINPNAMRPDGSLMSFSEQYEQYLVIRDWASTNSISQNKLSELISQYTPIVLAPSCEAFDIPALGPAPLVMPISVIKHISTKHDNSYFKLNNGRLGRLARHFECLVNRMADCALTFQDARIPTHYIFVLNEYSEKANQIITIVEPNQGASTPNTCKIVSNHGCAHLWKKIVEAWEEDREFYVTERTGEWLTASRDLVRSGETELRGSRLAAITHLSYLYVNKYVAEGLSAQDALDILFGTELAEGNLMPEACHQSADRDLGSQLRTVSACSRRESENYYGRNNDLGLYNREPWRSPR